jgi:hypothetical protein
MNRFPSSRCASAIQIVLPLECLFLEQPEEFEDDHDNENHSNYVQEGSAHAGDSYQSECAVASIIQTERLPEYAAWEIHPVMALHVDQ